VLIKTDDAPDGPILVAVSGGSDSLAILHLVQKALPTQTLYAATVDHGLRPEAADEAKFVAEICRTLNIPHVTLHWSPKSHHSSQSARFARYELLVAHARQVGAKTIALGHTLDDQAETLLMRSLRAKSTSGTRGLSGMTPFSSYDEIKLWRPALGVKRMALQEFLQTQGQDWINDPSNEKLESERVRIRNFLNGHNSSFPNHEAIARLATLSAKSRLWLGQQTANAITSHCTISADGAAQFRCPSDLPLLVAIDVVSTLVLTIGGMPFRPSVSKLRTPALSAKQGTQSKCAVGRCLLTWKCHTLTIEREPRNIPPLPQLLQTKQIYDGAWTLANGQKPAPFIVALERFRTEVDDPVYLAVQKLVSKRPFPSVYST
jgi:tRNA(Ile)-lysidine synthase